MIKQLLSDSELEVMEAIWEMDSPVSVSQLIERFAQKKGWKTQTISTFAVRLVNKGFLTVQKIKNTNFYFPKFSKTDYKNNMARNLIATAYDGSVKKLFVSLVDGNAISQSELEEIRQWLSELE